MNDDIENPSFDEEEEMYIEHLIDQAEQSPPDEDDNE